MLETASVRRRLIARLVDLLFLVPITFLAAIPAAIICIPFYAALGADAGALIAAFLSFVLAYLGIEFFLLLRRDGQTLGKGLLGLRVVQAGKDVTLTPGQALRRIAVLLGPFILAIAAFYLSYENGEPGEGGFSDALLTIWLVVLLACLVTAAVDRARRRGVHDRVAGSRVVRAPKRAVTAGDFMMMVPSTKNLGPVDLTKPSSADGRTGSVLPEDAGWRAPGGGPGFTKRM